MRAYCWTTSIVRSNDRAGLEARLLTSSTCTSPVPGWSARNSQRCVPPAPGCAESGGANSSSITRIKADGSVIAHRYPVVGVSGKVRANICPTAIDSRAPSSAAARQCIGSTYSAVGAQFNRPQRGRITWATGI